MPGSLRSRPRSRSTSSPRRRRSRPCSSRARPRSGRGSRARLAWDHKPTRDARLSSAGMHRIDTAERRRRIGARHGLAVPRPRADLPQLADDLAGIHATDPASVYMELRARTTDLTHEDVERALYVDRALVKVLGM